MRSFKDSSLGPVPYAASTYGERLFYYIQKLLAEDPFLAARCLVDAHDWIDHARDLVTDGLLRRIMAAGRDLRKHDTDDGIFRSQLRAHIQEIVDVDRNQRSNLAILAESAIDESLRSVSPSDCSAMRQWAVKKHPYCYLCGKDLDFTKARLKQSYTLDHIWPRSLGGNSDKDNLLPACHDCNSRTKDDLSTWGSVNVHMLMLGIGPSKEHVEKIPGHFRFALQRRQVVRYAAMNRLSLKEAYLRLGPPGDVCCPKTPSLAHFFNLKIITPGEHQL